LSDSTPSRTPRPGWLPHRGLRPGGIFANLRSRIGDPSGTADPPLLPAPGTRLQHPGVRGTGRPAGRADPLCRPFDRGPPHRIRLPLGLTRRLSFPRPRDARRRRHRCGGRVPGIRARTDRPAAGGDRRHGPGARRRRPRQARPRSSPRSLNSRSWNGWTR
jgi:hypothetical protein